MNFWDDQLLGQILTILIPILATAVGGVITALGARCVSYLKEKVNSHKFNKYLDILNDTVQDVVVGLNQSTVNVIKEAAADGKLTEEEKKRIFETAKLDIYGILGPKGLEVLQAVYNDLDELIKCKIEATVFRESFVASLRESRCENEQAQA